MSTKIKHSDLVKEISKITDQSEQYIDICIYEILLLKGIIDENDELESLKYDEKTKDILLRKIKSNIKVKEIINSNIKDNGNIIVEPNSKTKKVEKCTGIVISTGKICGRDVICNGYCGYHNHKVCI